MIGKVFLLLSILIYSGFSKIHHLSLRDDSRRNIIISEFGYGMNGTLDIRISNFTVPDKIKDSVDSMENADKLGVIGFSLSRGAVMSRDVGNNPHVCQLQQTDQGFDALFLFADLPNKRLRIYRSGMAKLLSICETAEECELPPIDRPPTTDIVKTNHNKTGKIANEGGWFRNLFGRFFNPSAPQIAYENFIPMEINNGNQFSAKMLIKFDGYLLGEYVFMFHNCFNYRAHGYSDRVAVDLTVDLVERNLHSYLSVSEIPKPQVLLYMSILFFALSIYWTHLLCRSKSENIYRVHKFMTVLVFLKSLSLFFHGLNYYFLSKYGMQKEFWAFLFYITHLLKGLLLFGTIILIGTGYTFIKQFLTDRDRRVFMVVLPIQVLDNIFLIILSESEIGHENHQIWLRLFISLDILCCFLVGLPIVWSIQHLYEGATTDGKAAENLNKLRLFRQFYLIVVIYIYTTRMFSVALKIILPITMEWAVLGVVEITTFLFFIIVGYKFRPANSHNYLLLNSEFCDSYDVEAKEDEKDDMEVDRFVNKVYAENNVSRRVVSEESWEHQKLTKKSSQVYEQSLID